MGPKTSAASRAQHLPPIELDGFMLPPELMVPNHEEQRRALLAYRPRLASDMRNLLAQNQAWADTVKDEVK